MFSLRLISKIYTLYAMATTRNAKEKQNKNPKNILILIVVLLILAGLPLIFLGYQAKQSGLGWGETIRRIIRHSDDGTPETTDVGKERSGNKIDFLTPTPIGFKFTDPPLISHIQAVDLDKDHLLDVIVCDDRGNFISWIRQNPAGEFTEKYLPAT